MRYKNRPTATITVKIGLDALELIDENDSNRSRALEQAAIYYYSKPEQLDHQIKLHELEIERMRKRKVDLKKMNERREQERKEREKNYLDSLDP